MMLMQQHPSRLLSDYVLDLLPAAERRQVEMHLAACDDCRAVVQEERGLTQDVRRVLTTVTRPERERLMRLMPPVRPAQRLLPFHKALWRPAAALALFVILLLSTFQLNQSPANHFLAYPSATTLAATATHTPTVTTTSKPDRSTDQEQLSVENQPTPQPANTPLAAIRSLGS